MLGALMTCFVYAQQAHGRGNDFAVRLKADVENLQQASDKDPENFKKGIEELEKKYAGVKNPVERSVAHAMLASCYREMRYSGIADFDKDVRNTFEKKAAEHLAHVADDCEALASAKLADYACLFDKGDDDALCGGDMLAVMARYVGESARAGNYETAVDAYSRAKDLYRKQGNMNGYALMKMAWLEKRHEMPKSRGGISGMAYGDSLRALLDEVKDVEVGADVAMKCYGCMEDRAQDDYEENQLADEKIGFLKWAVANVAHSKSRVALEQALQELLRPRVEADLKGNYAAGRPIGVSVDMWNCDRAGLTVRRYAGVKKMRDGSEELLLTGEVVAEKTVVLTADSAYEARKRAGLPMKGEASTDVTVPVGRYVLVVEACGEKDVRRFHVSSMRVLASPLNDGKVRYVVADNETGRPLEGVKVICGKSLNDADIWEAAGKLAKGAETLYTGKDGSACADDAVYAVRSDDDFTNCARAYAGRYGYAIDAGLKAAVMTDRSIYRPGQTVRASVIAYNQDGDVLHAAGGVNLKVAVQMRGKCDTLNVVTNAMGSASFDYALPADCAVGNVSVVVSQEEKRVASSYIRVEEYKRPTFEVKMDGEARGSYGSTVKVKGVAQMLAGAPVQGAKVRYDIMCKPMMRWNAEWVDVDDDEAVTDENGCFVVPVELTDQYLADGEGPVVFRVSAVVTDVAGETREAEWNVYVGDPVGYYAVADGKCVVDVAKGDSLCVDAYGADGKKTEVKSKYRLLYCGQVHGEGAFVSGRKFVLPKTMRPGVTYNLEVTSADDSIKMRKTEWNVSAYNSALPVADLSASASGTKLREKADGLQEADMVHVASATYEKNGCIDMYFSTEETDAYVYINVVGDQGLVDKYAMVTDGAMKHVRLPYKKEWGEGVAVDLMYVRKGKAFCKSTMFTLAEPDKKLKLEWKTFRNRLEPGQREEWTLTVKDKDGKLVNGAEVMAVMYDAALDRIYGHSWRFEPSFSRVNLRGYCYGMVSELDVPSFSFEGKMKRMDVKNRSFARLIPFEHDRFIKYRKNGRAGVFLAEVAVGRPEAASMAKMADMSAGAINMDEAALEENEVTRSHDDMEMRSDFSETAFFMPHLLSDAKGDVRMAFTLPESLTEWKFMGLAHTADIDYGYLIDKVQARRELMLRPNMPRFVRQGDKVTLAASVVNMGEADVKGTVRMRLLDAATGSVVRDEVCEVAVAAGKTLGVDFHIEVADDWKDLDCEMTLVAGDKGDGERNALPVLPARRMVTETVPFFIQGEGNGQKVVKDVDLSGLFNGNSPSADSRSLAVEYMDGPAWMCVEALRSVKNPESDNAVSWSAALAANASLLDVMRSFPVVEKYENADSLRGKVAEAEKKLAALAKADGGWAWFKGMDGNRYVTLSVCENLADVPQPSTVVSDMLKRGVAYLDSVMLERYNDKKRPVAVGFDNDVLRYLSLAARVRGAAAGKEVVKMRNAYAALAEKNVGDLTVYGMAEVSMMLRDCGKVKTADRLVETLKNYTVVKPGLGRFYATDAAYYSWMDYRIPTQVAAMRAIMRKDGKDAFLPDMLLWIVAQKQVQKWDNPMTAIKVARLLMKIEPLENLREVKAPVVIVDGGKPLDMRRGAVNASREKFDGREPNLSLEGCVVADAPSDAVADGVKTLRVEKEGSGLSWGAAYATFAETEENLKAYGTGQLVIKRECYVQRGGVGEWTLCGEGEQMNVGDKVRLHHVVTSDRDMDFVKVVSPLPACFELASQLSGYRWMGGRGAFLAAHDSDVEIYFDWFRRGTATMDVECFVARAGHYSMGAAAVECEYAKQYGGHTKGQKVTTAR